MEDIEVKNLDPSELKIDPVNERVSNVNPHSKDGESLQDSVEELGVIEPIVVREIDGVYKVVAGQRRTLAAQAAEGVDEIPARIVEMDDSEAKIVSITENAEQFKKDVPKEDRANAIKSLMEDGYSTEEIANRMGVSNPTVRRWVEPALDYWEETQFEADPEKPQTGSALGDISLGTLQTIRQNTNAKERRERVAEKIVQNNVSQALVSDAASRSANEKEFEEKVDQIIDELNSDVRRFREEVHISGEEAEQLDRVMKNRGVGEKEAIELLVEERLSQIDRAEDDEWIQFFIEKDTADALRTVIGERDVPPKALAKQIVKQKLTDTGYLE